MKTFAQLLSVSLLGLAVSQALAASPVNTDDFRRDASGGYQEVAAVSRTVRESAVVLPSDTDSYRRSGQVETQGNNGAASRTTREAADEGVSYGPAYAPQQGPAAYEPRGLRVIAPAPRGHQIAVSTSVPVQGGTHA